MPILPSHFSPNLASTQSKNDLICSLSGFAGFRGTGSNRGCVIDGGVTAARYTGAGVTAGAIVGGGGIISFCATTGVSTGPTGGLGGTTTGAFNGTCTDGAFTVAVATSCGGFGW